MNARWSRLELRSRLIVAFVCILAGALAVTVLVTTLAGPTLFRNRLTGSNPIPADTLRRAEAAFRAANALELVIVTGIAVVLIVIVSTITSRSILASLNRLASAAESVAAGDYGVRVPTRLAGRELDTVATAFNEMADKIQNTEATRRQMLGDLAHEMATPLATLDGYLEAVDDGVAELDSDLVAVLRGQVARLTRLTDDIHAISAADEGRLELHRQVIPVAAAVTGAAEAMRPAFADKHVRLTVRAEPGPLIDADSQRLVQVLTNLLKNALRHTPPGGEVAIRTAARRDLVDIVVADTGEGIAPEHLPHLFERFYRAHANSGGQSGGSGVGLTISRAIVVAHQGKIAVHSDGVGKGTEVTITLPRGARKR